MRTSNLLVAVAVALAATSACGGGGGDSSEAFCDELVGAEADVTGLAAGDEDLAAVVARLQRVDPPDEIAGEFESVVAAYDSLSESGALTDPAAQVGLVEVHDDLAAVSEFVAEECDSG